MKERIFLITSLLVSTFLFGQGIDKDILTNQKLRNALKLISENKNINADSALSMLASLNEYPSIKSTGKEFIFFYDDPVFGKVPVKVFIPENYSNKTASPLVLLLHGAESQSRHSNIDTITMTYKITGTDYTQDIFYDYLGKQNFVVVRPVADVTKRLIWAANRFRPLSNPTFNTLSGIIIKVKEFLNIDDSRVFAFGHSDGSDGAFGLDVYQPSLFAGFVGYNSMLTHISGGVYFRNLQNRPLYLVHSDLDDLRPIQQTRQQIQTADSLELPVHYKEYIGYGHEDKHLEIDKANGLAFIQSTSRNPFLKEIYWETSAMQYDKCDWLRITSLDTLQQKANWQNEINWNSYNKKTKQFEDMTYYVNVHKSGAVRAYYNNNYFNIQTSRVAGIELLISPVMVNLQNAVTVTINGKEVFNNKISADKNFLINNFKQNFDRQALWITSLKLNVE